MSNVVAFPQKRISLERLAREFVASLEAMKPSPFGRYSATRLEDGTVISRIRNPPGSDERFWYSLTNESRELFFQGGRAIVYRENEEFWRQWLTSRRAA